MARFRKKPVEVEAVRWTGANEDEMRQFCGSHWDTVEPADRGDDPDHDAQVFESNHSQWISMAPGFWVIKGTRGELYPCDPQAFADVYESAEPDLAVKQCPSCGFMSDRARNAPGFPYDDPWHAHPELRRRHSDPRAVYAEEIGRTGTPDQFDGGVGNTR